MLAELLLAFAILYAMQICIFAAGAYRAHYSFDTSYRPVVSIVIAARNEEQNVRDCLESIERLTYPKELLDVVIVNDRSRDGTPAIVQEFTARLPFMRLHTVAETASSSLRGKTNAVAEGLDLAHGEILLFTDADCRVPEGWVEETVKYYSEPDVGLVAGFTSLRVNRLFDAIQALDWFVLFSIAAATIRLHFPVTAVGNNLSVRRKAYDDVGGYRRIPFSITEDYALFHAITSTGHYKAKFPVDAKTLVTSLPCADTASLFRQKKRWFIGGADMDLKSIALFANGFLFKSLLLVTLVVDGPAPVIIPFAIKVVADFLLVNPALRAFGKTTLALSFLPFELYYILYVVVFPPIVLFSKNVTWKDRHFRHDAKENALRKVSEGVGS